MKTFIKKKSVSKYWFLFLILFFAIISPVFWLNKRKHVPIVCNKNKEMHWGWPMSRPPAPMIRFF